MIKKENHPISKVSWLASYDGEGYIRYFYEPETIKELITLCSDFYSKGLDFDIIGHTSNTLYTLDYVCERMISTRKLNSFQINENSIICECGTSVRSLSMVSVEEGVKGFEGYIDLPGTVASAIYGHATCYECDLSKLLVEATILTDDGKVKTVKPEWFEFNFRSSALKRKEKEAIILKLEFKRENGDVEELKRKSLQNHEKRSASQPEAKNSLGSIFAQEGKRTLLNYLIALISRLYGFVLLILGHDKLSIKNKRKHLTFKLLFASDVEPYVRAWNWYQWKDERSHALFWKYVKIHKLMFTKSEFEIIIKK